MTKRTVLIGGRTFFAVLTLVAVATQLVVYLQHGAPLACSSTRVTALGRARTCSDVLGRARTCSDVLGRARD